MVTVSTDHRDDVFSIAFRQTCPATPGQEKKLPFHMPIALGLIDADGRSLVTEDLTWESDQAVERRDDTLIFHLCAETSELRLPGLTEAPEVSLLRGFSAPVKIDFDRPDASLARLATMDPDGFAAWDALQTLLVRELARLAAGDAVSATVSELFGAMLTDMPEDAESRFLLAAKLTVPTENYLFEQVERIDVDGVCRARDCLLDTLARDHADAWQALLEQYDDRGAYSPDADAMAARALKNCALGFLGRVLTAGELEKELAERMSRADNLTDRRALLQLAVNRLPESDLTARMLAELLERWREEALVVNQWFAVQASGIGCDVRKLKALVAHPAFEIANPNKVRSVLSTFAGMNQRNFHAPDGSGYGYIAEQIVELNGINPQMAAALAKPLTRWRRYAGERSSLMRNALMDIAGREDLSADVFEVVTKSLA